MLFQQIVTNRKQIDSDNKESDDISYQLQDTVNDNDLPIEVMEAKTARDLPSALIEGESLIEGRQPNEHETWKSAIEDENIDDDETGDEVSLQTGLNKPGAECKRYQEIQERLIFICSRT